MRDRRRISAAVLSVLSVFFVPFVSLLLAAAPGVSEAAPNAYFYQFDDIYGPSGKGGQWVVRTTNGYTRGAPVDIKHPRGLARDILTSGNFVTSRDHIYIDNGEAVNMPIPTPSDPIDIIFMAITGDSISAIVGFNWIDPVSGVYTQDVRIGEEAYRTVKTTLSSGSGPNKRFQLDMTKINNQNRYETTRTYMRFQQDPDLIPAQAILAPLVIANVSDGTALENPLLFRNTMRNNYGNGDIVAYDHFNWKVDSDLKVGGNNDWIFIPLDNYDIDSNTVNYSLLSDITNYSGIRYALQRYDTSDVLRPVKWVMDLPAGVQDIKPELTLDPLSHIPPGLITTYAQSYNVVKGSEWIFSLYGVGDSGLIVSPKNLTLNHPPVFGYKYANEESPSGGFFKVTGFELLQADNRQDFLRKAASRLGQRDAKMPTAAARVMDGAITTGFVTADAISTIAVNSRVPSEMLISDDVAGLLPLHITFNLPRSNRYIVQRWETLMNAWKSGGNINTLFSNMFSIYAIGPGGREMNVTNWLRDRGLLAHNVKVFMDEDRDCVTVSFIAVINDSRDMDLAVIDDHSDKAGADYKFLVIRDGNPNDAWDTTIYIAPTDNFSDSDGGGDGDGDGSGGGGGGGCDAGAPVLVIALSAVGLYLIRAIKVR